MLHVHHAGRAERLVDALVELLLVPPDDPFTPEVVAVPSRAVQRWLQQQLARRLGTSGRAGAADGVAANIEMPFPGRLLRPRLATPDRDRAPLISHAGPDVDPWQPGPLTWRLLHVAPAAGITLAGAARARQVAELFDRYAVYRPALLHAWAHDRDDDADAQPLDPSQRWQPRLWRAAARSLDVRTSDPATRLRHAVESLVADPALADLPGRMSVLAFGALPASSLVVLDALATGRDVHVLLLHPSPGWWAAAPALPAGLPPHPRTAVAAHHPLLVTWGQVASETHQALRAGSEGGERVVRWHALDAEDPQATEPPTLLGRLQRDLRLDRAPVDGPVHEWRPDDDTVQVHACHGLSRQVEVLRGAIAHLLADPAAGLVPADVLVLCPDLDRARPLLASTLAPLADAAGGATPGAPSGAPRFALTLAGASSRTSAIAPGSVDDPLVDGFLAVLRTARGRSTATSVAALAALAPVRRRLGFSDTDIARLDTWIEAAHVRWGLDAAHLAEHHLPDEVAITGWEAALDRLLLGIAMAPDEHRVGLGDRRPSRDVGTDGAQGIGRLAELVHRLRVLRPRLAGRMPASSWSALCRDVHDTFLAPDPGQPWQPRRLSRLLDQLDHDRAIAGDDVDPELTLDDVLALIAAAWQHGGGSANWGSGGITICSLGELRGVPFPVVCLLGLDDDTMRAASNPPDDLLTRAPRVGDRDARTEQRAVLLDALLAARRHLVVLHDGHDVRTNQPLAPAVPLAELLDVIDLTTGTGPAEREGRQPTSQRLVVHHPRQAFAEDCLRPGALGRPGPWSFYPDALAAAERRRRDRTAPLELCDLLLPTAPDPADTLTLGELAGMLCNPVGTFLDRGLGLRLPRSPEERSDLVPTSLDALGTWQLVQHLLDLRLRDDLTPDEADVQWHRLARADGALPAGRFADRPVAAARAAVDALTATLAEHGLPLRGSDAVDVDLVLPDGRRLVGTVGSIHTHADGRTLVRTRSGEVRAKDVLPTRIELLALAAAGHRCDALFVGASGAAAVFERPTTSADVPAALVALGGLVDLATRCTRSALPIPTALTAVWADALTHPKRKYRSPADAWKYDRFTAAVDVVFGDLDEHQMAARRALDDGTPAGQLAQLLWRLLEGVPG